MMGRIIRYNCGRERDPAIALTVACPDGRSWPKRAGQRSSGLHRSERALYDAAKASSLAGKRANARTYDAQPIKICERGDTPGRAELIEARQLLKSSDP
jgi:hypothetical protein